MIWNGHDFAEGEQRQYNGLCAAGRTAYDDVRWAGGTHEEAMQAGLAFGWPPARTRRW